MKRWARVIGSTTARLGAGGAGWLPLAGLALVVVLLPGGPVAAWVVTILAALVLVGGVVLGRRTPSAAPLLVVQLVVISAALRAAEAWWTGPPSLGLSLTVGVLLLAGLAELPLASRLAPRVRAAQLPGYRERGRAQSAGPFSLALAIGGLLVWAVALLGRGGAVALVATVGSLLVSGAVLGRRVRRRRRGLDDQRLRDALSAYSPAFLVYFSGPREAAYQVRMWIPYLERLGERYAIVARDYALLDRARDLSTAPLVATPGLSGLDACVVDSVRAVFYVNTHAQCVDGVRYLDRQHVHLNHGDSDKPASYHPMISMFDQIFVAGEAAIDRFTRHGVVIPREKFVVVGRPQVEAIASGNTSPLPSAQRTVLYGPTWRGGLSDMDFGSLPMGLDVVSALVGLGVRVVFRPHPLSRRDAQSSEQIERIDAYLESQKSPATPHLTSSESAGLSVTECFNIADALVTDVSSLVSDFLYSGKPMAVAVRSDAVTAGQFPVLEAAYLLRPGSDLGGPLGEMLGADPMRDTRIRLREYYLGHFVGEGYADVFVDAARRALGSPREG